MINLSTLWQYLVGSLLILLGCQIALFVVNWFMW